MTVERYFTLRRALPTCGALVAAVVLLASAPSAAQTQAVPATPNAAVPTPAPAAATPAPAVATPEPAPKAAAAPESAPAPASGGTVAAGEAANSVRLRSLEKNVNELKEQIFRTKARLNLLKETVLGGTLGASRAVIRHKNEMGSSYSLIKAVYALDGVQIYSKSDDSGRLAEMKEFDVYNGAIQPGSHTLSVVMLYQGNGFGVFSYLKGYKMNVKSSQTFVAGEAKATAITVVGYEKGNMTTNLQDRPAVDFRVNVVATDSGTPAAAAAAAPTKK